MADATSPPRVDDLLALGRPAWRDVVAHARRALRDIDDAAVTPVVKRLRSTPANKFLGGRPRRELAQLFAEGGAPWVQLHRRLAEAEVGGDLAFLLDGTRPEVATEPDDPTVGDDTAVAEARETVDRLRDKVRTVRKERDEARTAARGTQTRLDAAEQALAEARERIARLEADAARMQDELAGAARDRDRAVDRERRRQDATIAALRQELTDLRRADEQRRQAADEREREAAARLERERVRAAEAQEAARVRRAGASDLAAPGRPSELPPGAAPGTTAHAKALLGPGRRVLVDGYNVAKTVRPDLADESAERSWLEQGVQVLAATRHVLVEVFWDGDQREGHATRSGDVVVRFSPRDVTADDDIEFAVAALPDDEPLVVVTDDRGLRDRLLPYRVDLLGTQAFGWVLRA